MRSRLHSPARVVASVVCRMQVPAAIMGRRPSAENPLRRVPRQTRSRFSNPRGRSKKDAMERIPILRMGPFLLVTIQVDMHDKLALTLQEDLTDKIVKHGSKGVLLDISALEIVDSFIGRMISN